MPPLATTVRDELLRLVEPITLAAGAPGGWAAVLSLVGHADDDAQLRAALDGLAQGAAALAEPVEGSWEDVARVLEAASTVFDALRALESVDPARFAGLGPELAEQLTGLYLRRHHPALFRAAGALTLVEPFEASGVVRDATRLPRRTDALRFDRVDALLDDPWGTLRAAYLPNDLATADDAHEAARRLFPQLALAAQALGITTSRELLSLLPPPAVDSMPPPTEDPAPGDHWDETPDRDPDAPPPGPPPQDASANDAQPRLVLIVPPPPGVPAVRMGVAVTASAAEQGAAGFVVSVAGALAWTETRGAWKLTATSSADVPAFVAGPGGLSLATPGPDVTAAIAVERVSDPGTPALQLGAVPGTRVELGALKAELSLTLPTDVAFGLAASTGRLVIAPGDGDGFLQAVLPANGVTIPFDAGVKLSARRGLELSGSAGLEAVLPSHIGLGALGRIDDIRLSLAAAGRGIRVAATCTATLRLGPVEVAVDRIGVAAVTTFPEEGGNLGIADLDVGFQGPAGMGLGLDLGIVAGRGSLLVDGDRGRYLGSLSLDVAGRAGIDILGILDTRNPGFSLLLAGVATLPAGIPLGFGFELQRIGGILALNRRLDGAALLAAVTTGELPALLAPAAGDPAQAAAALDRLLPYADGGIVVGILIGVGWGEPTLATIDLALIYDVSTPDRISVAGTLAMSLPLVAIRVDLAGYFEADPLTLDLRASLRDSRLAGLELTGDAALKLQLGDQPAFLLSLGGFNPGFVPPTGFPALRPLQLALPPNPLVELSLTGYVAVTSSTLQFGAALHFWAGIKGVLGVEGYAEVEALLGWAPVHFEARLRLGVKVKAAGKTLFGAELRGSLSGPGRWRVQGGVYIEVAWWEVKVHSVDAGFGSGDEPAVPPIDVGEAVAEALRSPGSWRPVADRPGALIRPDAEAGGAVLHPPAAGVEVVQARIPLGLAVDRVGTAAPAGARTVVLTRPRLAGSDAAATPVEGFFAPGQFLDLPDEEVLAGPSFQRFPAGLHIATAATLDPAAFALESELTYETIPEPPPATPPAEPWWALDPAWAVDVQAVAIAPPRYAVASVDTLEVMAGGFSAPALAAQAAGAGLQVVVEA